MKFKSNSLKPITAAQYKEKLSTYVDQVKRAEVPNGTHYHYKFADGIEGISIITDTVQDFIHRCDHFLQGRACSHIACAYAVATMTNHVIKRFGALDKPEDFKQYLGSYQYEDINIEVGLPEYIELESNDNAEVIEETEEEKTPVVSTTTKKKKRNAATSWNEVEEFLKNSLVSRQIIQQVKAERKTIFDQVKLTEMTSEPRRPDTTYMGLMLERAIKHILLGESLLLVGAKGSGKDTLVATLSWIFGLPMYLQTGHKGYTAETLVGDNMPTGNGMEVKFKYTAYATSVMAGGLVHFAELNMLLPDATSIFHSVYDGNNQLSTPYGTVDKHACHVFIASINVGEQYAGIKSLNEALKDRLAVLHMPTSLDFNELISSKTGLTDTHLLGWMQSIKQGIETVHTNEGIGSEAITLRGYIKAAAYLIKFGSNDENNSIAIEDYVLNRIEDREERYAVRNHLRLTCWNTLGYEDGEKDYDLSI